MLVPRLATDRRFLLIATLVVASCSTVTPKPPEPAPAIVSLQEYVQQASKAAAEGSREKARETYRTAAKAYPASQLPWLKLAEDYFEAADYGNAILAAQEVLLRDAKDNVAASLLAVSGLRVSASALQSLRSQSRIAGGTRSEAETMARTLREVLGENVLVPQPVSTSSPTAAPSTPPAVSTRPRPRPAVVNPTPVSSAPPAKPAAATSTNPFDKLK